jgi:hypothetical protein
MISPVLGAVNQTGFSVNGPFGAIFYDLRQEKAFLGIYGLNFVANFGCAGLDRSQRRTSHVTGGPGELAHESAGQLRTDVGTK